MKTIVAIKLDVHKANGDRNRFMSYALQAMLHNKKTPIIASTGGKAQKLNRSLDFAPNHR